MPILTVTLTYANGTREDYTAVAITPRTAIAEIEDRVGPAAWADVVAVFVNVVTDDTEAGAEK